MIRRDRNSARGLGALAVAATIGLIAPTLPASDVEDLQPAAQVSSADALAQVESLSAEGKWSEAIEPAEQLARAVAEKSGPKSLAYAEALTRVAELQRRAGDFTNAELGFANAIAITEARTGGLSGRLIEPLTGLGLTYADMREHARAAPVLERAVLTIRRNRGLFDVSQIDLLAQLATSQTQIREFESAVNTLRYRVRVAEQAWGPDDPRVAGPVSDLADWYSRASAYDVARSYYRAAIERAEKGGGPDHVALVEPLRGLAENSMRAFVFGEIIEREDLAPPTSTALMFDQTRDDPRPGNRRRLNRESEDALERALGILRTRPEGASGIELAATLLQAGDWYLAKGDTETAHARYREAWDLSQNDPDVLAATQGADADATVLGYPVAIYLPGGGLDRRSRDIPEDESVEHFVLTEFTVAENGSLHAIEVIETDASERQARDTVAALEAAIYRPQYVEGKPVVTTGVRYRDVYRERRSDGA
ncbi:MAG TPA: tetratricopeptide repeat protein [Steroidobacteraceae bacterium]|nr:tetratricopeptide repeat protein [Steroidobacteraceae bacterium]